MNKKYIIALTLRVFVSASLAVYGLGKAVQFGDISTLVTPVNELTGMQLMWAFFGYTRTLPIIIGVFQIVGSLLLLFRKTKLIGAFMLTPILMNIILFDIFYEVGWVLINALVYQACLFLIMYFEKDRLFQAWLALTQQLGEIAQVKRYEVLIGYTLGLVLFLFFTASLYLKLLQWMGIM